MSQLMGIITRLQSLQETAEAANEPMQRYFEVNGEKICSVKYFEKNQTFELTVFQKVKNLTHIRLIISTWFPSKSLNFFSKIPEIVGTSFRFCKSNRNKR